MILGSLFDDLFGNPKKDRKVLWSLFYQDLTCLFFWDTIFQPQKVLRMHFGTPLCSVENWMDLTWFHQGSNGYVSLPQNHPFQGKYRNGIVLDGIGCPNSRISLFIKMCSMVILLVYWPIKNWGINLWDFRQTIALIYHHFETYNGCPSTGWCGKKKAHVHDFFLPSFAWFGRRYNTYLRTIRRDSACSRVLTLEHLSAVQTTAKWKVVDETWWNSHWRMTQQQPLNERPWFLGLSVLAA